MSMPSRGASAERRSSAARAPTIERMSFLESCVCCASVAPSWSSAEYGDWVVLLSRRGEYLGVACVGCVADEELLVLVLELESSLALA
jgi:hypothetical protein